ncbi:hypothetical protein OS493_002080 [Desmophyllum pertusum]|uniref:Uncharacterized protein n=1 Tax=Desmophyllum pertusum TaxID=174260 RepID=A0A9X0CVW7_9CNID|nr:hypothetical protein OS493_002080 [Desmophyllum pertusum]
MYRRFCNTSTHLGDEQRNATEETKPIRNEEPVENGADTPVTEKKQIEEAAQNPSDNAKQTEAKKQQAVCTVRGDTKTIKMKFGKNNKLANLMDTSFNR